MHCFVSGECACACECCQCTSECSCSTTTNAGDGIQTTPSSYVVASSRPDPASDFVSTMPLPFACSGPSSYSVPDPFRQDREGDDALDWGGVGQDQVHRTSGLNPRALQSSIIPSNCTIGNGSTTTTQLGHRAGGLPKAQQRSRNQRRRDAKQLLQQLNKEEHQTDRRLHQVDTSRTTTRRAPWQVHLR